MLRKGKVSSPAERTLSDWDRPRLRTERILELLENLGTPDAKEVLAALAAGAPDARLTLDAASDFKRVESRSGR